MRNSCWWTCDFIVLEPRQESSKRPIDRAKHGSLSRLPLPGLCKGFPLCCVVGHLAAQRSGSRGAPLALRPMQLVVSHHFLPRPKHQQVCVAARFRALTNSSRTVSRSARLHCRRSEEIRDYYFRTLILSALVAARGGVTESLTCTVKRYGAVVDAADVGLPLITPLLDNAKPGGRGECGPIGIVDHVYGGVPPVAASVTGLPG